MQALFDLLAAFSRPLLLVGGHALTAYGVVRQTIDVDCLIAVDDKNALAQTLKGDGYREIGSTENAVRYASSATALPDVDVLLVDAATFEKLFTEGNNLRRAEQDFRVPSLRHLIALKLHAIRNDPRREARDFADIAELLRLNPSHRATSMCVHPVGQAFSLARELGDEIKPAGRLPAPRRLPLGENARPTIAVTSDITFPEWEIPAGDPTALTDDAYLEWLVENRAELIRQGLLEKLRNDPVRQPVNARFVL
jgi:hypothetical protein